jgi:PleD family two-component response regulator
MSLRQSDVITRYGSNQVMILLLKAVSSDLEIVTERIAMNWESKDISALCKITYETSELK